MHRNCHKPMHTSCSPFKVTHTVKRLILCIRIFLLLFFLVTHPRPYKGSSLDMLRSLIVVLGFFNIVVVSMCLGFMDATLAVHLVLVKHIFPHPLPIPQIIACKVIHSVFQHKQ